MLERTILKACVLRSGAEQPAVLRERLKGVFPPGASRRMTLLGMLVGSAIARASPEPVEAVVYSSAFGESLSLEAYLRSYPCPSPTLFQSSIHPSAFQQQHILAQRSVARAVPLAGGPELVLQSALACAVAPEGRLLWCGGEERGSWLRELGIAADESFAFAMLLGLASDPSPIGRLRLEASPASGSLSLGSWARMLDERVAWSGPAGEGWTLHLEWTGPGHER